MLGKIALAALLTWGILAGSCQAQTAAAPPEKREVSAIEEARALIEPKRLDETRATTWVLQLFATVVVALLVALVFKVKFFSPRVATQHFESQHGPAAANTTSTGGHVTGDRAINNGAPARGAPVSSRVIPGFDARGIQDDGDFPV